MFANPEENKSNKKIKSECPTIEYLVDKLGYYFLIKNLNNKILLFRFCIY